MTLTAEEVKKRLMSCPLGDEDSALLWLVFGVLPGIRLGQMVVSRTDPPSVPVGIGILWCGKESGAVPMAALKAGNR